MSIIASLRQFITDRILSLPRSQQLVIVVAIILPIAASIITAYFYSGKASSNNNQAIFSGRYFRQNPFNLNDAYDSCLQEARASLGGNMLRAVMDPLSTRYEEDKKYYLMVLNVHVGTVEEWVDVAVYCTVDPGLHEVSYYKEVYAKRPSLMSRTIDWLGDLQEWLKK